MSDFLNEYNAYCQAHGKPDRIDLLLCDINGVLRGKWLPSDQVEKLVGGETRLPHSTYAPNIFGDEIPETGLGIEFGDPDAVLNPISGTLQPVPWAKGNAAQVLVEMTEHSGEVSYLSARNILKMIWQRFKSNGWHPVIASELEFYLLKPRENPTDAPCPPDKSPDAQNYDMEVLSRSEDLLIEIQSAAAVLNLPADTMIAEFGPGQFEINFHHTDDVLAAADTTVHFRRLVRGVAAKHGMEATFMAKPYSDHPGNGMHLHASVLDSAKQNIFGSDDGIAKDLQYAVGGVLDSMRDLQAIFAPHQNSYRRYFKGGFAPCAPDWGLDDRNAGVRLPETKGKAARLEHRISGADVNPYLAIAAILGGMLHGLENKISPPAPLGDATNTPAAPLETDWTRSLERFKISEIAKDIFGEKFIHVYATLREYEIDLLQRIIPPSEYQTYLSRF